MRGNSPSEMMHAPMHARCAADGVRGNSTSGMMHAPMHARCTADGVRGGTNRWHDRIKRLYKTRYFNKRREFEASKKQESKGKGGQEFTTVDLFFVNSGAPVGL